MNATVARAEVDSGVSIIRASVRSKVEVIGECARSEDYQLDAPGDESFDSPGKLGSV